MRFQNPGFPFPGLSRAAVALILLLPTGVPAREKNSATTVGLDELIRLTLENDLELDALRAEWQISKARARELRYWDDPELRLRASRSSDTPVPAPYVETVSRTRSESSSSRANLSGTGGESSREIVPGVFSDETRDKTTTKSDRETRVGRSSSSESQTTRREITPMRDRLVVRESTRSSQSQSETETRKSGQSFQSVENRSSELFPRTSSGSGSTTEKLSGKTSSSSVSEQIQERLYAQDPYAGGDRYSVELRLRPRNPWEVRGESRMLHAESSLAEFVVRSAGQKRLISLLMDFRAAQFAERKLPALRERLEVLKTDLAYWDGARASGGLITEGYQQKYKNVLESELELERAIDECTTGRTQLAMDAGLSDPSAIDLSRPGLPPLLDIQGLNTNLLVEIALQNNPELGDALFRQQLQRARLDVKNAARIPWLTFIAVEYGWEERYGDKYQDEYGVFAGVQIPVFSWMNRDLGAGERAALDSLARRRGLLEKNVTARLNKACQNLRLADAALEHFRTRSPDIASRLEGELKTLPAEGNAQMQKTVFAIKVAMVDMQSMRIDLERRYADALLGLESVLGSSIHALFTTQKVEQAPSAPKP